jgi:hypothetical protein
MAVNMTISSMGMNNGSMGMNMHGFHQMPIQHHHQQQQQQQMLLPTSSGQQYGRPYHPVPVEYGLR